MHVAHPFGVDGRGRTAEANDEEYLRQLVEIVLFTLPGERVYRPDFGTGLTALVFEPNNDELRAAVEYLVHSGLQRWLGDLIQPEDVSVSHDGGSLAITIQYLVLRSRQRQAITLRPGQGTP
jgi:phage baseplate assembly protein W